MTVAFFRNVEVLPVHTRGARALRVAAVRRFWGVAPAIKEGCKVVLTITCLFVILAASVAFDVWVWVPRSIH
jgi:hypothetical protein